METLLVCQKKLPQMYTNVNASEPEPESPVNECHSIPFMAAIDDAREKLLSVRLNQLTNAKLDRYLGTSLENCNTKVDKSVEASDHESDQQPSTSDGRHSRLHNKPVNYQESSLDNDTDGQILSDIESKENWQPPRRP